MPVPLLTLPALHQVDSWEQCTSSSPGSWHNLALTSGMSCGSLGIWVISPTCVSSILADLCIQSHGASLSFSSCCHDHSLRLAQSQQHSPSYLLSTSSSTSSFMQQWECVSLKLPWFPAANKHTPLILWFRLSSAQTVGLYYTFTCDSFLHLSTYLNPTCPLHPWNLPGLSWPPAQLLHLNTCFTHLWEFVCGLTWSFWAARGASAVPKALLAHKNFQVVHVYAGISCLLLLVHWSMLFCSFDM